jgi:CheY-like chemotaxis protein
MSCTENVLVVEDDPDMLALTMMMVRSAGYEARGARHGQEALEQVASEMPAVILLDMLMPVMDGWQFARNFRTLYGHAAVIVVTTAAENAQERSRDIGADDVLAKPFDLERLLAKVRKFCPSNALHAPA